MATTTRKKRKIVKKNSTKKKVSRTKVETSKDYIDIEDLRQIENLSKDVQIAKMEMHLEEQSLKNMSLQLELFQKNIISQRQVVQAKSEAFENRKIKYAEYKNIVDPKYGFKNGEPLGYNPETGEIIRN